MIIGVVSILSNFVVPITAGAPPSPTYTFPPKNVSAASVKIFPTSAVKLPPLIVTSDFPSRVRLDFAATLAVPSASKLTDPLALPDIPPSAVIATSFLVFGMKLYPQKRSWLRVVAASQIYFTLAFSVNKIISYWYCSRVY